MQFNLHTHETIIMLAGLLGLLEQEVARLFFALDPSPLLSGTFGSMVLGSIGLGAIRGSRKNGNGSA